LKIKISNVDELKKIMRTIPIVFKNTDPTKIKKSVKKSKHKYIKSNLDELTKDKWGRFLLDL